MRIRLKSDLQALRLAIIHCSNEISLQWQSAFDKGWIYDTSKRKRNDEVNPKHRPNKRQDVGIDKANNGKFGYQGNNPKPKCSKCSKHHATTEKCNDASSSSSSKTSDTRKDQKQRGGGANQKQTNSKWNKTNRNTESKNTNEDKTGETHTLCPQNDKLIDTDIISYIIPSYPITSHPNSDILENYITQKRPRDDLCDTININITVSDIELLNNIFDNENSTSAGTVPVIAVSQKPSIVNTLVDSGSLKSNYIDVTLFDRLKAQGVKTVPLPKKRRVCSGLAGVECQEINEYIELLIVFINQSNNKEENIIIQCHPIHMRGPFSLILGLPTIQRHKLASKFNSVFEGTKYNSLKYFKPLSEFRSGETISENQGQFRFTDNDTVVSLDHIHEGIDERTISSSSTDYAQPDVRVPTIDPVSHDSDNEQEDDSTQTRYEKSSIDMEALSPSDGVMSIEELKLLVKIFGPESLQKKLRKLLRKYRHIFSSTVSPEPALVDNPMEIKINSSQWFSKHNRLPPRAQSQKKEEELKKYIQALLLNNVIQPSTAKAWSQVLLVPKPGVDVWRLCIDYRNLNATTLPTEGHPLLTTHRSHAA